MSTWAQILLSGAVSALLVLWVEHQLIKKPAFKKRKQLLMRMLVHDFVRAKAELDLLKERIEKKQDWYLLLKQFPWSYFSISEAWKFLQFNLTEALDEETIDILSLVFSHMEGFRRMFQDDWRLPEEVLARFEPIYLKNINDVLAAIQAAIKVLEPKAGFQER